MLSTRQEDKSEDGGLISVDRNSKATLPLTIPRPLQVVYKGSGAGKRRLGFNASNTAELHSTVRAGRTRLGTGDPRAPYLCDCFASRPLGCRCF